MLFKNEYKWLSNMCLFPKPITVNNGYRHVIDKVTSLIKNSDIENKVMVSNRLIDIIEILKILNNNSNLLNTLEDVFKDISIEDSKEIMKHVYSSFFFDNNKKRTEKI